MAPRAADEEALSAPLLHHEHQHSRRSFEELPPGVVNSVSYHGEPPKLGINWLQTTAALLTLQLGWGLWLLPSDFARLGWLPGIGCVVALTTLTAYSGFLYMRLFVNTPGAVLFGDVGARAAGKLGRGIVYAIIYSLDATRCVILHLAATQSLRHIFPEDARPPLWQCGAAVWVLLVVLVQIRSLAELSWVFLGGTAAQLVAIGIVVYELVSDPNPQAKRTNNAMSMEDWVPCTVALLNMVFAYGGQFAFTEIMGSMHYPRQFPRAVTVCTIIMSVLYGGLGAIGYWSRGDAITGIVIFSLGSGKLIRIASAFILVQATAQALCQVNVWAHNVLVLILRGNGNDCHDSADVKNSADHCRWRWLIATLIIVSYSYGIAISVPFFSTLVGLVTAATYLSVAYALPSWFTLRMLGSRLLLVEKLVLWALIPAALAFSGVGFYASSVALINDMGGGEGGWDSAPGAPSLPAALLRMVVGRQ